MGLGFYAWLCPIVALLWGASLYFLGMYRSFRLKSAIDILGILARSALISFISFTAVIYVFKVVNLSRSFIILAFGLATVALCVEKSLLFLFFKTARRQGFEFS